MNKEKLIERLKQLHEKVYSSNNFERDKINILLYLADLFTEFLEEKAK